MEAGVLPVNDLLIAGIFLLFFIMGSVLLSSSLMSSHLGLLVFRGFRELFYPEVLMR